MAYCTNFFNTLKENPKLTLLTASGLFLALGGVVMMATTFSSASPSDEQPENPTQMTGGAIAILGAILAGVGSLLCPHTQPTIEPTETTRLIQNSA